VSAVLIPQLVDVVDTLTRTQTYSSGTVRQLTACGAEPWGLYVEFLTPEDPAAEAEACWLLPADGLRLSARRPRSRQDRGSHSSVLTAVRIEHDTRHWRTTDMLLGLTVVSGSVPRFTNAENFAAAAASGLLRPGDADVALQAVHRTLEQLAAHRHDLGSWLASRGIMQWPPSF
jgi:predicted RNA-binding protein associated with RNAse of E/G family